jgi:putative NADH-flavin reductase
VSASRLRANEPDVLITAVKIAGLKRMLVVSGAARAGGNFLNSLRTGKNLDWTFVSSSAAFIPRPRTENLRRDSNERLVDTSGNGRISTQGLAIALVDELERPRHSRQRVVINQTIWIPEILQG